MVKFIDLKDLNWSLEEIRGILELLAKKRNVNNYERMTNKDLLSFLKITENLTPEKNTKKPKNKKTKENIIYKLIKKIITKKIKI